MNRKQRMRNRTTAAQLKHAVTICPECGERGSHWVQWPMSLEDLFGSFRSPSGFWTCAKFYGPDGRRLIV